MTHAVITYTALIYNDITMLTNCTLFKLCRTNALEIFAFVTEVGCSSLATACDNYHCKHTPTTTKLVVCFGILACACNGSYHKQLLVTYNKL